MRSPPESRFVAEIAGVSSSRDVNSDATDPSARHTKILQSIDVDVRAAPQHLRRERSLKRECRETLRHVVNRDVETLRVLREPPEVGLGRRPAEALLASLDTVPSSMT